MGVVQLSDELQSVIERQVAEGRAISSTAFLEEAIMRLVDDTRSEWDELRQAAEAGSLDMNAGRYTTVTGPEDGKRLQDDMMARLRARISDGE